MEKPFSELVKNFFSILFVRPTYILERFQIQELYSNKGIPYIIKSFVNKSHY